MGSKYFRFVAVIICYNFNLYTLDMFDRKDEKDLAKRTTNFLELTNNSEFRSAFDLSTEKRNFVHFIPVRRGIRVRIQDTAYLPIFVQLN